LKVEAENLGLFSLISRSVQVRLQLEHLYI
jgi:hypothetical protein